MIRVNTHIEWKQTNHKIYAGRNWSVDHNLGNDDLGNKNLSDKIKNKQLLRKPT